MSHSKIYISSVEITKSNYNNHKKTLGINLVGLMVSSLLGAFMLAVIIRVMVTINDNLQIAAGIAELDRSARIIDNLFTKFFTANGFGANTNTNKNIFAISTDNNTVNFSIWYASSPDNTQTTSIGDNISCSGRTLVNQTDPTKSLEISISMSNNQDLTNNPSTGFIKCLLNYNNNDTPTEKLHATGNIPLVNPNNMMKFFIATIVKNSDPNNTSPYHIIPVINANLTSDKDYDSVGIKVAVVLRTSMPVFNKNKFTSFTNILGINSFNFTTTDKYLYKLVIIESPFVNSKNSSSDSQLDTSIKTSILNF